MSHVNYDNTEGKTLCFEERKINKHTIFKNKKLKESSIAYHTGLGLESLVNNFLKYSSQVEP